MKPWIYLADLTHTGLGINARTFPLGIGCVAAHAKQELGDEFQFKIIKFPEHLAEALRDTPPSIMCFSHYVWNSRLTHEFARYAKQLNPNMTIVYGGPNFPIDVNERQQFLDENRHIDFYIKWDGELAFVELLQNLLANGLDPARIKQTRSSIPNCCYVDGDDYVEGPDQRVRDLSSLPSPYLMGLMDEFFEFNLDILFETTRGCPYSCTFCNDGHIFRSKVFRKTSEMIREELEYIVARVAPSSELHFADLNFGMYTEDLETSRTLRHFIDQDGWPKRITAAFGKSHPDRILEAVDIINKNDDGILKFGASFQTTDPFVLENIERKNIPLDRLMQLRDFKSGEFRNLEFFTELIVPLPGDTVATHVESLRTCIDDLGMNNIDIHQLTALPGTKMAGAATRDLYEFDVRHRVYVGCLGVYEIDGREVPCAEIEEVVVGTNTISFEGYLECRIFDFLVKTFIDHDLFSEIFGLLSWLEVSEFGLIEELKENHLSSYPEIAALVEKFVGDTKAPLYEDLGELKSRLEKREFVDRYVRGELGRNETLWNRSLAYLEHQSALHQVLRDATIAYLDKKGLLTPLIKDYVDQAAQFSELRKFDPRKIDEERTGLFDFDFIQAGENGFRVDPTNARIEPTTITFQHKDSDLPLIHSTLAKWTDEHGINFGKVFQKGNLKVMARDAWVVAPNE